VNVTRDVQPGRVSAQPGGVLVGVGIEFAESKAANSIYVSALLPGGPAFESGRIAVTDILVAVDDKDVKGCSLMALADRVLGLPETPITLTLRSPTDASQVKQVTLQRRAAGANGVQRPRSPVGLECASYSV
jgi:C-terminal processing protease CtpA/Prc